MPVWLLTKLMLFVPLFMFFGLPLLLLLNRRRMTIFLTISFVLLITKFIGKIERSLLEAVFSNPLTLLLLGFHLMQRWLLLLIVSCAQ